MMELILVACLLKAPDTCREHHLTLTVEGMDPGQCLYSSVPRISRWQVMNVGWKVQSWRCALITDEKTT